MRWNSFGNTHTCEDYSIVENSAQTLFVLEHVDQTIGKFTTLSAAKRGAARHSVRECA